MDKQHHCNRIFFSRSILCLAAALSLFCTPRQARADGFFTLPKFVWNKRKDINEPMQKAIIVFDKGHEDLLLQVKYEGPADEFGWLVPVPTLPKVERGSMECFYELSKLTQKQFDYGSHAMMGLASVRGNGAEEEPPVKVIEVKTVGAYEVAVLSAKDANSLAQWLEANDFAYPSDKVDVLEGYIKKQWHFVAARIQVNKSEGFKIASGGPKSATTRQKEIEKKLASGELHPLMISFDTATCVYPLKISSINGCASEVQIYTLSSEALIETRLFDSLLTQLNKDNPNPRAKWEQQAQKHFETIQSIRSHSLSKTNAFTAPAGADDAQRARMEKLRQKIEERRKVFASLSRDELEGKPPEKPTIYPSLDEVEITNVIRNAVLSSADLPQCTKQFPALQGKTWTLVKNTWTFSPEQMEDLEFVPAAPMLVSRINNPHALFVLENLRVLGANGVEGIVTATKSTNAVTRLCAASLLGQTGRYAESARHITTKNPGELQPKQPATDSRITAAIEELLDSDDMDLKGRAVESAADQWDPSFTAQLIQLLSDPNEAIRRSAVSALQSHLTPESPESRQIVALLGSTNVEAQASAVLFATRHRLDIPRKYWLSLLKNPHLEAAATMSSRFHTEPFTREELSALAHNPTPLARLMALKIAARTPNADVIDVLLSLLNDPTEAVRMRATTILQELTGQQFDEKEIVKWRKWWQANKATFTPKQPAGRSSHDSLRN